MHSQTALNLDNSLRSFAESLKPPPEYLEDGKALADKVFKALQAESKYIIAEVRFGGSFGKKSDVIEPDLDLVVVINDHDPPFDNVIKEFKNILMGADKDLEIRKGTLSCSKYVLHFDFKNGIDVDLLPAANLEEDEVIRRISKNPDDLSRYYSSSLVRKQIAFMTSHSSSFLHSVVRLGKFWFKTLHLGEKKLKGGSCMMEMIGVAAAEDEEKFDYDSIRRAFNRFLVMIERITTLKLVFEEVSDCKWVRVPRAKLCNRNKNYLLVPDIVGSSKILKRPCYMVEPANPHVDFLADADPRLLKKLMKFASITKKRLSAISRKRKWDNAFLLDVFDPLPSNLTGFQNLDLPRDILVGCDYRHSSVYGKINVRNYNVMERDESRLAIEILKQNLLAVVNTAVKGDPENVNIEDVEDAVDYLIGSNLNIVLEDANDDESHHQDMDVTITIPYQIGDKGYAVKLSLDWNEN